MSVTLGYMRSQAHFPSELGASEGVVMLAGLPACVHACMLQAPPAVQRRKTPTALQLTVQPDLPLASLSIHNSDLHNLMSRHEWTVNN
jgi:hypothetical protein